MKKLIIFSLITVPFSLYSSADIPVRPRTPVAVGIIPPGLAKYAVDLQIHLKTLSPDVVATRMVSFMDIGAESLQGLHSIMRASSLDEAQKIARYLYNLYGPIFKVLAGNMFYPSEFINQLDIPIALQPERYTTRGYYNYYTKQ